MKRASVALSLIIALAAAPLPAALPPVIGETALPTLAPMIKKVSPAVVNIATRGTIRERGQQNPLLDDPFFRRFFDVPPDTGPRERPFQSAGSGVIFDAKAGYILTNAHVVENATEITVTLQDGRDVKAEVLGSDAPSDVAVLKVKPEGLSQIALGDSAKVEVGDFVVAIGNPFGLQHTVTSGIISGLSRSGINPDGYEDFIQTDASINPGNSGGALVNLRGELVGINTASFNPQGSMAGNIGLGFAIPSNLAGNVMRQLASTGQVRRGSLGVDTQTVDARVAQGLHLDQTTGAVVTRVYPDSAGAAAGLQPGDVIVGANGQAIGDREALHNFEGLQGVGTRVALDVRRDGKPVRVTASLREQARSVDGGVLDPRLSGATFTELPERLRQAGVDGVLVEHVARGSRAAGNGLQDGDVVIAANRGRFDDLPGFQLSFSDRRASQPPQLVLRVVRGDAQGDLPMQ